jgi:hypothetical protein
MLAFDIVFPQINRKIQQSYTVNNQPLTEGTQVYDGADTVLKVTSADYFANAYTYKSGQFTLELLDTTVTFEQWALLTVRCG